MAGAVVEVRVKEGSTIKAGDPIAILSAMKMETIVTAPNGGVVSNILVSAGESLSQNDLICEIHE
jgi:pyruvate carboxylase